MSPQVGLLLLDRDVFLQKLSLETQIHSCHTVSVLIPLVLLEINLYARINLFLTQCGDST